MNLKLEFIIIRLLKTEYIINRITFLNVKLLTVKYVHIQIYALYVVKDIFSMPMIQAGLLYAINHSVKLLTVDTATLSTSVRSARQAIISPLLEDVKNKANLKYSVSGDV